MGHYACDMRPEWFEPDNTTQRSEKMKQHLDPYKGDRVPVTYATFPETLEGKRKFYAKNCDILADVLERVPNTQHNQGLWANVGDNDAAQCNTRGCAMGWAAMSHAIKGLQYEFEYNWGLDEHVPEGYSRRITGSNALVNGKTMDYDDAGLKFFGAPVVSEVFMNVRAGKRKTISNLRKWAERYRTNKPTENWREEEPFADPNRLSGAWVR